VIKPLPPAGWPIISLGLRLLAPEPNNAAPGQGTCCGLDISIALADGLKKVEGAFQALSRKKKYDVCHAMVTEGGWDINQLTFENPNRFLAKGACGGPGPCSRTVTVNGECHLAENVNYVLWGKMNRLCHDWVKATGTVARPGSGARNSILVNVAEDGQNSNLIAVIHRYDLETALGWVTKYRKIFHGGTGIPGREAWTKAGWNGDYKLASGEQVANCKPCPLKYTGVLTLRAGVDARGTAARRDPEAPAIIDVSGNGPNKEE
jgi:hypothetical protein